MVLGVQEWACIPVGLCDDGNRNRNGNSADAGVAGIGIETGRGWVIGALDPSIYLLGYPRLHFSMSKRIGNDPGGDSRYGRQEDANASKKDKSNKGRSRISAKFVRAFSSLQLGSKKEESERSRIQERAPTKEPSNPPEQGNTSTEWFREAHNFSINNSVINNHMIGVAQPQPTPQKRITHDDIHFETPPVPKVFTGRDPLVKEAVEILCRKGQNHLAILGPGGIGKTSLALVIGNNAKVQRKFRKLHFLPCDILEDVNDILQGFMQVLKIKPQEGKSDHDSLYDYLQTNKKAVLFILDNFETPWNHKDGHVKARSLIEKIGTFSCVTFILTMRGMDGPGDIPWHNHKSNF
ncbi:hypothetical protein D9758_018120 [Tetrapyrgos nigripes]|uniref:Novel STAND NTPase 1 domain-containing protein n=1 Tax=Tetrapyrgos nigripes TaxID=182062 RepID=A0A8H5BXU7_9AGAR|nr:hypothetical protein D9758_018120 [Tetrapyrgos nigripes]